MGRLCREDYGVLSVPTGHLFVYLSINEIAHVPCKGKHLSETWRKDIFHVYF